MRIKIFEWFWSVLIVLIISFAIAGIFNCLVLKTHFNDKIVDSAKQVILVTEYVTHHQLSSDEKLTNMIFQQKLIGHLMASNGYKKNEAIELVEMAELEECKNINSRDDFNQNKDIFVLDLVTEIRQGCIDAEGCRKVPNYSSVIRNGVLGLGDECEDQKCVSNITNQSYWESIGQDFCGDQNKLDEIYKYPKRVDLLNNLEESILKDKEFRKAVQQYSEYVGTKNSLFVQWIQYALIIFILFRMAKRFKDVISNKADTLTDVTRDFIIWCLGALVVTGFLGTVVGISFSLSEIVTEFGDPIGMVDAMSGIGSAFGTTKIGLASSLALGILAEMLFAFEKSRKVVVQET